jgi:hypothetical protein
MDSELDIRLKIGLGRECTGLIKQLALVSGLCRTGKRVHLPALFLKIGCKGVGLNFDRPPKARSRGSTGEVIDGRHNARLAGLEPVTFPVTGGRSNQLSYSRKCEPILLNFQAFDNAIELGSAIIHILEHIKAG